MEYLPVDQYGRVDPCEVASRIRENTACESAIFANYEFGTINLIDSISAICRNRGVSFHTDEVQAAVYLSADVQTLNVDFMALGGQKFFEPKGVGVLYVRNGIPLLAIQTGGGQEMGLRDGMSNIPYIIVMTEAFRCVQIKRHQCVAQLLPLQDHLIGRVLEEIPNTRLTGHPTERLPNHASFVFEGVDGKALLMMLDMQGFACSSGSAYKTGNAEPSEVLTVLGLPRSWALDSLRVILGYAMAPDDVERLIVVLLKLVDKARLL